MESEKQVTGKKRSEPFVKQRVIKNKLFEGKNEEVTADLLPVFFFQKFRFLICFFVVLFFFCTPIQLLMIIIFS